MTAARGEAAAARGGCTEQRARGAHEGAVPLSRARLCARRVTVVWCAAGTRKPAGRRRGAVVRAARAALHRHCGPARCRLHARLPMPAALASARGGGWSWVMGVLARALFCACVRGAGKGARQGEQGGAPLAQRCTCTIQLIVDDYPQGRATGPPSNTAPRAHRALPPTPHVCPVPGCGGGVAGPGHGRTERRRRSAACVRYRFHTPPRAPRRNARRRGRAAIQLCAHKAGS